MKGKIMKHPQPSCQKTRWPLSLLLASCFSAGALAESIQILYPTQVTKQEQTIIDTLESSQINTTLLDLSHSLFPFKKTLTVSYGGDQGPLYDPETHTVHIPFSFYTESLDYFRKNEYQKTYGKSAESGAINTMLHTLLHEAGHAYIADQNIAILGKEEDAVDNFATLLLIDYVENGDEIAISAADMFAFESEDKPEYYDLDEYIDEHSFDLQRYFATLCLVYGSNPERHPNLLDEIEKEYRQERTEFCQANYQTLSDNWHRYLTSAPE
ncbi:TPA: hypothetical protein I7738_01030 [Vibrio vulnificus]|nr:hypothetical protein [Vibrio vulnificus]HAS8416689.1 hypothetical protein [Vibrio vulnificus]HAS8557114.1 hypothetical protein [Vibrio vulnificus]HAU8296450.1 hypothetical protein [Vibrio vulnificus]